jgi:hypothetical protein
MPEDVQLVLTPGVMSVLNAMEQRCAEIGECCGAGSPEHLEALTSLIRSVFHMLRLGGRITKDDDLSLFGASYIAYGVIFHPHHQGGNRDPLVGSWSVHS